MRNNQPISQREYQYPDDATLMSTTDAESRITYANDAFIEVSGFASEDIIGQPHNVVRHPDMPSEAFQDMWSTIGHGRSWKGLVKNRRASSDARDERQAIENDCACLPAANRSSFVNQAGIGDEFRKNHRRGLQSLYLDFGIFARISMLNRKNADGEWRVVFDSGSDPVKAGVEQVKAFEAQRAHPCGMD